jgi:hypothetical protein
VVAIKFSKFVSPRQIHVVAVEKLKNGSYFADIMSKTAALFEMVFIHCSVI